jgi:hypothetical protein
VHRTEVYSAGVSPKGPALKRFPDIKKNKKKKKNINEAYIAGLPKKQNQLLSI